MTTEPTSDGTTFSGTLVYDSARDELSISFEGRDVVVPGASVRRAMRCEMRIERIGPGAGGECVTVRLARRTATRPS